MKPRERKPQAQTSRMYLRKQDHRDLIVNDIYHNAIWMDKEQDGELIDDLVWLKYPKNYLITGEGNANTIGTLDIDRQIQHQHPFNSNQRVGTVTHLNGFCVALDAYSSVDYIYVSEDGCVWKRIPDRTVLTNPRVFRFGLNGVCNVSSNRVYISRFEKNEETDEYEMENITVVLSNSCYYVCSTNYGCIVGREESYQTQEGGQRVTRYKLYLYRVDENGSELCYFEEARRYSIFNDGARPSDCSRGSYIGFAFCTRQSNNASGTSFRTSVYAYTSIDDGLTWKAQELYYRNTNIYQTYPYVIDKLSTCIRDDYMVVIFCDAINKITRVFKTLTQEWFEIELPSWVDLPVVQYGGKCVAEYPTIGETLRLAIKGNATTDANAYVYDMIAQTTAYPYSIELNGGLNHIQCKDGKVLELFQDDEFLYLGSGNTRVYFDSLNFIASSKAFAYIWASFDSTDGSDYLIEHDYCLPHEHDITPMEMDEND